MRNLCACAVVVQNVAIWLVEFDHGCALLGEVHWPNVRVGLTCPFQAALADLTFIIKNNSTQARAFRSRSVVNF